ncbi:hypothetical protein GC167_05130 [bacterium]|nr:hypothetical protein [bacterium]
MSRSITTVFLFVGSSIFMTLAWYAHLKLPAWFGNSAHSGRFLFRAVAFSWGLAFFEYCLQVPANRLGFKGYGGPFSLVQLRVLQEVIALLVFVLFVSVAFPGFKWSVNHVFALMCLIGAVYFAFR